MVYAKYINPKHYENDRKWFDVDLDLRDYANQKISIIFEVLGSPEIQLPFERKRKADNRDDYAIISDPKIVLYNPKIDPTAKNIIFVSIDTLRADHLGCYGYKRTDISPNIDKLAQNGILFENAIAHSSWTIPSHMSMFTSLLPSYHRVNETWSKGANFINRGRGTYRILSENITTLAEVLRSRGYITAAFTGGHTMVGEFGFSQGFDNYNQKSFRSFASDPGFNKLTEWLETHKSQRFFLFLHTFRVHAPYVDLTYAHEVMTESEVDELNEFIKHHSNDLTLEDTQRVKLKRMGLFKKEATETLYNGGINETDKYIGRLIETLNRLNLLNHTIIILTSDHGEEFSDHNPNEIYNAHGHSLYDEMIRVPLIWVVPANFPKGKRIKSQVRLIDIMPTLLDLSNIKYDATKMQGTSLLPIIRGEEPHDSELVAISEALGDSAHGLESKSIRTNRLKYIYTAKPEDGNFGELILLADNPDKEELYDLANDPGERFNLQAEEPNLSNVLKNKINDILEDAIKTLSVEEDKRIVVDEEMRNKLKALGYIQ